MDGRLSATGAGFEIVVEAPPGLFAEGRCGSGDCVEGAACEAHVCDGGRGEVGCYLRYHLGWEAEDRCGGHLGMLSQFGALCYGLKGRGGRLALYLFS